MTFNIEQLLADANLSDTALEERGLHREALAAIYDDHVRRTPELEPHGTSVATVLGRVREVHSLRSRVKNPEHVVRKILRKTVPQDGAAPEDPITVDNYRTRITDLLGVRALHLYKSEWTAIGQFIRDQYELVEQPFAYVREGDSADVTDSYREAGLDVRQHSKGYRSVHYLVRFAPTREQVIAEVQVRTIFEEGWSEIDHRVRYPDFSHESLLEQFLGMFNRIAGSADEMGTFVQNLATYARTVDQSRRVHEAQVADQERRVRDLVRQLNVGTAEKQSLLAQIAELTARTEHRSATDPSRGLGGGFTKGLIEKLFLGSGDLTAVGGLGRAANAASYSALLTGLATGLHTPTALVRPTPEPARVRQTPGASGPTAATGGESTGNGEPSVAPPPTSGTQTAQKARPRKHAASKRAAKNAE